MDEYISREDVLKKAKSSISVPADNEWDCGYNTAMAEMQEFINQLPSADVQPVRHGRWITKAKDYYKAWQDSGRSWDDMPYFITGKHIACSECFTEYDVCTEGIEHWIGCPCCLAKMGGDAE